MPALASDTDTQIPDEILKVLTRHCGDLSMLPEVAQEAQRVAKNPNCSITEFARVVERDVKLAADILALANSSLFTGSASVSSLHQSIVRLGMRQCQSLIYCASLTALMKKMSVEDAATRERLWKHSFHTAILALHFNHSLGLGFQGEEFTAGLMHDFGRILIGMCLPGRGAELDLLDFDNSPQLLTREILLAGVDHGQLGAWFARRNRLPSALVAAVRFHHQPELAGRHMKLVALTSLCDHMANHLQRWGTPDGYDLSDNPVLLLLDGAGSRGSTERIHTIYPVLMRNAQHDAEVMMRR